MKHVVTRIGLQEQLANAVSRPNTSESQSMLVADVSGLEAVRKNGGRNAYAMLLQQINRLCETKVRRRGDVIAKCGDNRYAVLLQRCPSQEALHAARVVRATVQRFRFQWKDQDFNFGVSIGVVPNVHSGVDSARLLEDAGQACDAAKRKGASDIEVYADGETSMSVPL